MLSSVDQQMSPIGPRRTDTGTASDLQDYWTSVNRPVEAAPRGSDGLDDHASSHYSKDY